ncbi:hypothetical protein psal_cds_339 [Pandoravirus salinus]|uniref:Uncharacterized protein n=1 Tax=Pandoravirus salinus TaxID=1349410 RepID=S4W0T2_9VIRU|nr:hypothetical protein psal_cds_339 [Pandoravirus salinus]AGO83977.1 hypothetical protein psal_cds_339 [Pandoravirus salinus]
MDPTRVSVVADLPIELWRMVFDGCDRSTAARLGATCAAFYAESRARAKHSADAARLAVDAFIDMWQRHTSHWDDHPQECDHHRRHGEHSDSDDDDDDDKDPPEACTGTVRWSCEGRPPDEPWHLMLCDSCMHIVAGDRTSGAFDVHPADLNRPHVWGVVERGGWTVGQLWADAVGDALFGLPVAAVHLVDPDGAAGLSDFLSGKGGPILYLDGASWASLGSLRGWIPLVGARGPMSQHCVRCVPMLCCDTRSPLWATVALVECAASPTCDQVDLFWNVTHASLDALLGRYRSARAASPFADDWVTWAWRTYTDPAA